MPNNRIAILFDANDQPVDAWSWDNQYSWGGPNVSDEDLQPGDRLEYYDRRLTKSELKAQAKAAEDKIVQDRLEAARALLRAAGELPETDAPIEAAPGPQPPF